MPLAAIHHPPFTSSHMSTIAPGHLFNATDAASFVALSQQNWVIGSRIGESGSDGAR